MLSFLSHAFSPFILTEGRHFPFPAEAGQHIKINLAKRAANLSPITREALLFLLQRGHLSLSGDRVKKGKIIRGLRRYYDEKSELGDLNEAARILGAIFGKVNDPGTVFTSLGLTV